MEMFAPPPARFANLPPARPLSPGEKLSFQRFTDRFAAYWVSESDQQKWRSDDSKGLRMPIYSQLVVPAPEHLRRPNPSVGQASGRLKRVRWRRFREDHDFPTGDQATKMINNMFSLDMTLTKILGKGGQGAACLFEGRNVKDGSIRKAVVKVSLNPNDENVLKEVRNMRALAGASHIVQRLYARGVEEKLSDPWVSPDASSWKALFPPTPKVVEARASLDKDAGPFALEYMQHGDVGKLICKVNEMQKPGKPLFHKNQELWEVFHCLFRAVVAMAYPNRWDGSGGTGSIDPTKNDIEQLFEQIPREAGRQVPVFTSIIHFDIDPQNVMIGGLDSRHPRVPIVKVGDMGLGSQLTPKLIGDFQYMMSTRVNGKMRILTPEQNSRDWDFIDRPPALRGEPIAGKYGWWTNMYQAANVMWQILTGCDADNPPFAMLMDFNFGGEKFSIWTYGGVLLLPDMDSPYDATLRLLIAWCMAVNPKERPTMDNLEAEFLRHCSDEHWTANPELSLDQKMDIKDILSFVVEPPVAPPRPSAPARGLSVYDSPVWEDFAANHPEWFKGL